MAVKQQFEKAAQFNNKSVRIINKLRILQLLYWNCGETQLSISNKLRLSSPTITQTLQEFKESGLLVEGEEAESSGGRKPRLINFNYDAMHVVGVEVRRHHLDLVVTNLKGVVLQESTVRLSFENTASYWKAMNAAIHTLLESGRNTSRILGVGIAFPGEVSCNGEVIERATVLGIKNEPLANIKRHFDFEVYIENGASTAGFGAVWRSHGIDDAVYLIATDNGIAGSLIINNKIFRGGKGNGKAGAFGHMVLVPGGKPCFCGAKGCWTAYCALAGLCEETGEDLDEFFHRIDLLDTGCIAKWEEYLDYFAQALTNIRLGLDMDIIVGGKIAKYLRKYLPVLTRKVSAYPALNDEHDFIRVDDIEGNALAIGAALVLVDRLLSGRSERYPIR